MSTTIAPVQATPVGRDGAGPRITYVVSRWGEPTETFVRREATAVRDTGARVHALSMKEPRADDTGVPVTRLAPAAVLLRAVTTIFRAPLASVRVLSAVVAGANVRTIGPRLAAAMIGLSWSQLPDARADLLHAHFGWVSATAAWAASQVTGSRYTVVLHAFELHNRRYQDRFAAVPLRDAAQVFTISTRDRDLVRDRWGIEAEVLRMGVGDDWLESPVPPEARTPHTIVAVGSLVPKKGHDVLIDAVARTRLPWRLVVVGDGPERPALEHQIGALELGDRVELLGSCSEAEVRARLRHATVAALACGVTSAGDRDGIPVALVEAMACATPVVTTRVGAIPELVEGRGLLVEPGDAVSLAAAIDSIGDLETRRRLGVAGRSAVEAEFRCRRTATVVAQQAAVDQGVAR